MRFSLIPTDDHALVTRLKRQLMGVLSYLMFLGPLGYAVSQDWMRLDHTGLGWLLALAMTINVAFKARDDQRACAECVAARGVVAL